MDNEKSKVMHFAMEYGLFLGIYFIFKFIISVASPGMLLLSSLSWAMTVGIPFVIFWMLKKYRDNYNEGFIEYGKAWSLAFFLLFFASLPEALAQFIYFQWINPTYIAEQFSNIMTAVEEVNNVKSSPFIEELLTAYSNSKTPTAIQMAVQGIFYNILLGSIISLVIAAFVKRKPN